jgi:hypothetical protein
MKKLVLIPALALLLTAAGCGPRVITVQELTTRADKYDGAHVTVRGCYLTREGHAVLEPCVERSLENMVWVDDAADVAAAEVLSGVRQRKTSRASARAEDRERYDRLRQKPDGEVTRVTVQGEYQAATVGLSGVGYRRRLILDRVLKMQE